MSTPTRTPRTTTIASPPSGHRVGQALRNMRDRKASLEDYRIAEEYYAQRAAKASRRAQLARVARTLAEANQPTERQAVSRKAVNPHCGACLRGNCRSAACAEFRGIAEAGGMT